MKICVSPAKTMKCEKRMEFTQPLFQKEAKMLLAVMKQMDVSELKKIYRCNDKIAWENYERFQSSQTSGNALFSFSGLQYKNMQVNDFDEEDLDYAQKHVCIMSGLYGLVRPMDEVIPYRLDLENKISVDVYELYKEKIQDYLKDEMIIDCCSKEYGVWLPQNCIHIEFKVRKNNQLKTEATASKMARGQFVHYCVKNKVSNIDQLKQFHALDYRFDENLSDEKTYVFVKEDV